MTEEKTSQPSASLPQSQAKSVVTQPHAQKTASPPPKNDRGGIAEFEDQPDFCLSESGDGNNKLPQPDKGGEQQRDGGQIRRA